MDNLLVLVLVIGPGPPRAVTPTQALPGVGGEGEGVTSQKSPSPVAPSILDYTDVWKDIFFGIRQQ